MKSEDYRILIKMENKLPKGILEELAHDLSVLDMHEYMGRKGCSYISYKKPDSEIITSGFAQPGITIEDRIENEEIDWAIQIPVGGNLSQVKIQIYVD